MKTTKQFSIMMAVVILSFIINSCHNPLVPDPNFKNNIVTLYVDTGSINQQNIDSTCNFGQPKRVSNENYTTHVRLREYITWVGVSSSSPETDIVKIKKIEYVKGAKILNKSRLKGKTKVVGRVKYDDRGNEEKYLIEFTVFNNGIKRNGNFKIDPKLQIVR